MGIKIEQEEEEEALFFGIRKFIAKHELHVSIHIFYVIYEVNIETKMRCETEEPPMTEIVNKIYHHQLNIK